LRVTTRLLFLFEVTTTRHTRLRTIAERLGMTVQGVSEYANGLQVDGLLVLADGEYRATKKGVELLHDQFVSLRGFVDRAGGDLAPPPTVRKIPGCCRPRRGRRGRCEGPRPQTSYRVCGPGRDRRGGGTGRGRPPARA